MLVLERVIDCEGVHNLRDLGGHRTIDGRTVRWRTVFRADRLHRIDERGLEVINALGWRTVIDLRSTSETVIGSFLGAGIDVINLPILRGEMSEDLLAAASADDEVAFLTSYYLRMAEEGAGAIAEVFELLATPGRTPAVFHCYGGKDRTGVIAALLLSTLGVADHDVAEEYALSASAMQLKAVWLENSPLETDAHRYPKAFLACPPDAIHAFLRALRGRYGSLDAYMAAIGLAGETITMLKDALLTP